MINIKVSVIIPVYNSEKFLRKCLDSVVNQTLNDIEIIVVNDGSTDKSLCILNEYAKRYNNIMLINQKNSGQGLARNRAIDIARGEYLAFVDSDDYIEHNMLQILYKEAETGKIDVVICNWNGVDTDGNVLKVYDHPDYDHKIFDRKAIIKEFLTNKNALVEGFSWNKLIRRNLFINYGVRYPNIRYEDIPAMFRILTKVKKCKYINKNLYHYVHHSNSTVHFKQTNSTKDFIRAIEMVKDTLNEEHLESEFEKEYFIYYGTNLLREYYRSQKLMRSSKELKRHFKVLLKKMTLKKCLIYTRGEDFELICRVILYKLGLLRPFLFIYHKLKSSL
ncbi:glycosyltransferase [Sporolactobacillus putidus]|uniref:Glycosyl transferase n=1 Tax=Sporolactobacillus putidus TaxID=492735 RepID=A0A917S1K5_9BACL|nr:glycosyltransferase [Sporolactobacillus putidus]GGL50656.1 glycosyl transferase [Sporolactobacillus putidus]